MTDTYAGAVIRAQDFPAAAYAEDDTSQLNITSTAYVTGSPEMGTTFVAPTSGEVLLTVSAGMRDNSGNDRVHVSPQVFLGSDSTGTEILAPAVIPRGVGSIAEAANYTYYARTTLLTGLTAGSTYFARTRHKTDGGSGTADIAVRTILLEPTPLGGGRAGSIIRALDFPPAEYASDETTISNPTNTSYAAGSPEVSVTFMAPTSGRLVLVVGGSVGNSAGGNRIFLSPEVREDDSSGDVVLSPSVIPHGYSSIRGAGGFHYGSRRTLLEGLTAGATYFARVMHVVVSADGGTNTSDINARDITVAPAA